MGFTAGADGGDDCAEEGLGLVSVGSQHLNAIRCDDADVTGPCGVCRDKCFDKRLEVYLRRWMNSKQDNAGFFQWASALDGDLPEVLVER